MLGTPLKVTRHSAVCDDSSDLSEPARRLRLGNEESAEHSVGSSSSIVARLVRFTAGMSTRRRNGDYEYHAAHTDDNYLGGTNLGQQQSTLWQRRVIWWKVISGTAIGLPVLFLVILGILHIILVITGRVNLFWDADQYTAYLPEWGRPGQVGEGLGSYPTNATRDVIPIPCHSHNDYWRRIPLFDAVHAGCTSVEADVWLFEGDEELYVGHNTASLTPKRTLRNLYVDPLVDLLDKMNPHTEFSNTTDHGVFDEDPKRTLVLLVDFKTNGRDLFPHVQSQLEPLRRRNFLSYHDGENFHSRAITVVGTGNTPFELVVKNNTYRDVFFDAPLDELYEHPGASKNPVSREETKRALHTGSARDQGKTHTVRSVREFDTSNSYYASTSFGASIGKVWAGKLSSKQLDLVRGQIRGAKRRGLKSRYWDTPSWPTSLRNHIWQILLEEGEDMLNVDDLEAAAHLDWRRVRHDWFDA